MYIKNFHIEEFGPLKNFIVEDIPCAVAVFLGKNEAGKSSSMEFIRTMLTGIPSKHNMLTQTIRTSKGGKMLVHDTSKGDINIVRNFQENPQHLELFDENGIKLNENLVFEMLNGVSREVYRMIYGFNLLELQNIGNFHGSEIFNTILGASFGLGLRGPVFAIDQIQEKIDKLYKPRNKNTVLQKLFESWNNNKNELDDAYHELMQFDSIQKEQQELELSLASLQEEREQNNVKVEELQFLLNNFAQWRKWSSLQDFLAKLPPINVTFPEDAEKVLEKILEQKKIKEKDIDNFNIKLDEIDAYQNNNKGENSLLSLQQDILKLQNDKDEYIKSRSDISAITSKKDDFIPLLANASANLKLKWTLLDGQNTEREKLNSASLAEFLKTVSYQDRFLIDFSAHEAKILKAESSLQSANTALEYAERDLNEATTKKEKLLQDFEEERKKLMEKVHPDMNNNFINGYLKLLKQAKEASKSIGVKYQQGSLAFSDWKKQTEKLDILNPTEYSEFYEDFDPINIDHISKELINDENNRNYYSYISYLISLISEQKEQIVPIADQIIEQEKNTNEINKKLIKTLDKIEQYNKGNILPEVDSISLKHLDTQKEAFEKLEEINNQRTGRIEQLKQLNNEQEQLINKAKDNKVSKLTYLPSILCLLSSGLLAIIRFFGGQDYILIEQFDNILADYALQYFTSLYIPYWVCGVLFVFSLLSMMLPKHKSKLLKQNLIDLNTNEQQLTITLESLKPLKAEEVSIINDKFGIDEENQFSFYNKVFNNLNSGEEGKPVNALSLNFDKEESFEQHANLFSLSEQDDEPITNLTDAYHYNLNSVSTRKIIDDNQLYQTMVNHLILELKDIWNQDLVEQTDREEEKKKNNKEFYQRLLEDKKEYEKLLEENQEQLDEYNLEWDQFFQEFYFSTIPSPRQIEGFFMRIDACTNFEKRFLTFNDTYIEAYANILKIQEFAKKYFPVILQNSIISKKIKFNLLIDKLEIELIEIKKIINSDKDSLNPEQEKSLKFSEQSEENAKQRVANVEEDILKRKNRIDEAYNDCVQFLCDTSILSDISFEDYYERLQSETFINISHEESNASRIKTGQYIDLNLVRKLLEAIARFENVKLEYDIILSRFNSASAIISNFEEKLKEIIEISKYQIKIQTKSKVDPQDVFKELYAQFEDDLAKSKEKENMNQIFSSLMRDIDEVQNVLDEIDERLKNLFDLAGVQTESQLRELIEIQKQHDEAIRNSLAIEENFININLPKFIEKSQSPKHRQFVLENDKALPEIFEFFDEKSDINWQNKSYDLKQKQNSIDNKINEIQNRNGILTAKREQVISSTTLDELRMEQLQIEENIDEVYSKWLELSFAKQVIQKARKQYEIERQPKVIALASEYFATITSQAWEKIYLSLESKEIKVVDKDGVHLSTEILSQGAKEQLYLALRLAHIKNRSLTHQALPILMDDILVNFDSDRIKNTVEILNKIVSKNKLEQDDTMGLENTQQILYYTCHEDTARLLQENIPNTKTFLVENKTVRAID